MKQINIILMLTYFLSCDLIAMQPGAKLAAPQKSTPNHNSAKPQAISQGPAASRLTNLWNSLRSPFSNKPSDAPQIQQSATPKSKTVHSDNPIRNNFIEMLELSKNNMTNLFQGQQTPPNILKLVQYTQKRIAKVSAKDLSNPSIQNDLTNLIIDLNLFIEKNAPAQPKLASSQKSLVIDSSPIAKPEQQRPQIRNEQYAPAQPRFASGQNAPVINPSPIVQPVQQAPLPSITAHKQLYLNLKIKNQEDHIQFLKNEIKMLNEDLATNGLKETNKYTQNDRILNLTGQLKIAEIDLNKLHAKQSVAAVSI